jgi:hypothetical protein
MSLPIIKVEFDASNRVWNIIKKYEDGGLVVLTKRGNYHQAYSEAEKVKKYMSWNGKDPEPYMEQQ